MYLTYCAATYFDYDNNMKQYTVALFCAFMGIVFLFTACSETTTLGTGLVEADLENTEFTEDFSIKTSTISDDPVLTFSNLLSAQLTSYLVGDYNDPIFGQVRSSVFAQVSVNGAGKPNFAGNTLDSMVLVLPYNAYSYGDIASEYTLDVLRINEEVIIPDGGLLSDTIFSTDMMPIATHSFVPNNIDSIFIDIPENDTTILVAPQLRIPLGQSFAQELFESDEETFVTDSTFVEYFQGFKISAASENDGLFDLSLRSNSRAGLFVYYSNSDRDTSYQFPISSSDLKFASYDQDVAGSVVETFINNTNSGDSLFFVQGLEGVSGVIELPDLTNLEGDVTINKAELVVSVADLPEDADIYKEAEQLILSQIDEDGNYIVIEDVASALFSDATTFVTVLNTGRFGGVLTEFTDRPSTYTMNITAHLQNMLRGTVTNKMRLSVYGREALANRVALYGAGHSEYPVKLRVYYTKF